MRRREPVVVRILRAAILAGMMVATGAGAAGAAGERAGPTGGSGVEMEAARERMAKAHGGGLFWMLLTDRLELASDGGSEELSWELSGWFGGDLHRLWLESEGHEPEGGSEGGQVEVELLYGRAISPFFDLRAGLRHDLDPDPTRTFATIGLHGLAPYWFEVDAALYLSEDGDLSARLEAERDFLITQRLIAVPAAEVDLAAGSVPENGVGSGLSEVELGLRFRYELVREVAPYVGIEWSREFGETADLARLDGEDVESIRWVVGLRLWY